LECVGISPSSCLYQFIDGVLPICNIRLKAEKPSYLSLAAVDDATLGAELKRRRIALEWTQQVCADYFGILKDSYQKWEWNRNVPDIKNRKSVNDFLKFNFWDDLSNSLSNRVLLYRNERGIYKVELASILGVSESTIERLEKDQSCISNEMLGRFEVFITNNS